MTFIQSVDNRKMVDRRIEGMNAVRSKCEEVEL